MSKECHAKRCAKLGAGGIRSQNERETRSLTVSIAQAAACIEKCTKGGSSWKDTLPNITEEMHQFSSAIRTEKESEMHYSFGLIKNSGGQLNMQCSADTVSNVNKAYPECVMRSQDSFVAIYPCSILELEIYSGRRRQRRDDSNGFNKSRPYHLSSHT